MSRGLLSVCSILLTLGLLIPGSAARAPSEVDTGTARLPARVPAQKRPAGASVMFIENAGQWPEGARFQIRGTPQGSIWLTEEAIWITILEALAPDAPASSVLPASLPAAAGAVVRGAFVKLSFVGANPNPVLEPFDRRDTVVSYFLGNDPAQWRPHVPVWGGVRYRDLYPGIDLDLTGEAGQIMPRLSAQAGADLGAVRLRVEGAEAVVVAEDGLHLIAAAGEATWPLPQVDGAAFQTRIRQDGSAIEVTSPFGSARVQRRELALSDLSPEDNPADLAFSTFLGGSGFDYGHAIAVDSNGSAYVTGSTDSTDFPTTPGAFDSDANGSSDAFVAKLDATGSSLIYATFLGGSSGDAGYAIAADDSRAAYVAGRTSSSDFPTTAGAFDSTYNGGADAFVVKLDASGAGLDYATFVGASSDDAGQGLALDASGGVYVGGYTLSTGFPTTPGAFDTSHNGDYDAFVVKFGDLGSDLAYATLVGGSNADFCGSLAVDLTGSAYVTGQSGSTNFPTTPGAFDTVHGGGIDAFALKLDAQGASLPYSTFLGGTGDDTGLAIAVRANQVAVAGGWTSSTDFPTTTGAYDGTYAGAGDAYVLALNPLGSELIYATFLGGSANDYCSGIAVDAGGAAYLTGPTQSTDFPTTLDAYQTTHSGGLDAFVARLNSSGTVLTYSTFLGASATDTANAVAIDSSGIVYGTGYSSSSGFPTTPSAFDPSFNGSFDAYAVKMSVGIAAVEVYYGYLPLVTVALPDLTISSLEITQAVQTRDNSVPLVADRPTVVRIYAETVGSEPIDGVMVSLSGTRDGVPLPESPLNLGPQTVVADPSPANSTDSFNAYLPSTWLSGDVVLEAVVDPDDVIAENDETDNVARLEVQFSKVPPLSVMIVPVNYWYTPTGVFCPAPAQDRVSDWVMRAYPFEGVNVSFHTPIDYSGDLSQPDNVGALLREVLDIKTADGAPASQIYYGLVPRTNEAGDSCPYELGLGYIGLRASIGAEWLSEYTGWQAAHEFGHNFGRWHAPCGDPPGLDPDYPYADGSIGQYGFDVSTGQVYDPQSTYDIMSYCYGWISDYTYMAVYEDQLVHGLSAGHVQSGRSLFVRVSFAPDGQPAILPVYALDGIRTEALDESPFTVELLDATGSRLATHRVAVHQAQEGDQVLRAVSAMLPHPGQPVARVRLVESFRVVAERVLQDDLAEPDHDFRTSIEQEAGLLRIRWGMPAVPALVRYAEDGSQRWITLGIDVLGGELAIDPSTLPGGWGQFEIVLADSRQAPWTIPLSVPLPDSPPNAWITGPAAVSAGETVVLFGHGDDREDGPLQALEWAVDGVVVGAGHYLILEDLGPGEHVARLSVVDSAGNIAQAWHRTEVHDGQTP